MAAPPAAKGEPAGWAYLVRCADDSLYAGWTNDLDKRLAAHNAGAGAKYTRGRGPVRLAWAGGYPTRRGAMAAEARLKKLDKGRKEALAGSMAARGGALWAAIAGQGDLAFLEESDPGLPPKTRQCKLAEQQVWTLGIGKQPAGALRWGLFWDKVPFLNHILLLETYRGRGLGRFAMEAWEAEMRAAGHRMVMTSTQEDEEARHFYRRLGYRDAGSLELAATPMAQPLELLMVKVLAR